MANKLGRKPSEPWKDSGSSKRFQEKRLEWLACLNGDDIHAIWRQETSLLGDYALFLTIKEIRREATQNPKNGIGFNEPVFRLLEAGFAATQAIGIRRLTEGQWNNPTRRINSLKALVDDIRANHEYLTRKAYLACRDLPYDPEPIKENFVKSLIASGQFTSYIGIDTSGPEAWAESERIHKQFDELSETKRSPENLMSMKWLDLLDSRLEKCKDVCEFSNKYIAHAADPVSRASLTERQMQMTFSQLKACHQAIVEVITFIGVRILQDSVAVSVPNPQFDILQNLDKRWISKNGITKARAIWCKQSAEVENWASNF